MVGPARVGHTRLEPTKVEKEPTRVEPMEEPTPI